MIMFACGDPGDEYRAALRAAGEPMGIPVSRAQRNANMERIIRDAVQAHRQWAAELQDVWTAKGRDVLTSNDYESLAGTFTVVTANGETRTRKASRGVKQLAESGEVVQLQLPLDQMTAAQLDDAADALMRQQRDLHDSELAIRRIASFVRHSGAENFAQANPGVSIDDFLNGEALAS